MERNITLAIHAETTGVRTPSQWFVAALSAATLVSAIVFSPEAEAACMALVNGCPMTAQECGAVRSVYGSVLPGRYAADARGNWVNLDNPRHRGNIYTGGRGAGGGGRISPFTSPLCDAQGCNAPDH